MCSVPALLSGIKWSPDRFDLVGSGIENLLPMPRADGQPSEGGDPMYYYPAFKMDPSILQVIEFTVQNHSMDSLLEGFLGKLLQVDHVRKAEVLLFDKRNDLVCVATAMNSIPAAGRNQEIRVQSWLLESSVRHSTRRIRLPQTHPVLSIPLVDSEGILGFLNIQWDHVAIADSDRIASCHVVGLHLGSRLKEVMLKEEISRLRNELESTVSFNRENVQQITSLSKELYAMMAISTKINQSMDYDKALWKSMAKIRDIFTQSSVVVRIKKPLSPRRILPAEGMDEGLVSKLLNRIEGSLLKEIMGSGKPVVSEHCLRLTEANPKVPPSSAFKTIAGAPLKSRARVLGALLLLNHSNGSFSQDQLRLLSGVANIMGMAIENMSFYHQTEQKMRESAFLVRSIAKFNAKLDLAETLRSVAEKSADLIGLHCHVFLFSETRAPLVEAAFELGRKRKRLHSKAHKKIVPAELEELYRSLSKTGRALLVRSLTRSRKISLEMRRFLRVGNFHSLMAIPL
ncbi:MAG: GAF domain-containing protein, partial [Deltaproteobacteria bacterium]